MKTTNEPNESEMKAFAEALKRRRERDLASVAVRSFHLNGNLKIEGSKADFFSFQKEFDQLFEKYHIEKDPFLNITIVRVNGIRTPIAKLDA
ncbi:MAG: hypothetical protein M0R32_05830 [Candidatus Cloacimonetes bacterium]|jgi:hypothetical protein|nr:hypothetical protein [Candidatus Cloacimonadota bacterium]